MIQIYSPGNTNFKQNGDMTLFPEICEASSELGGAWILEITHPIDDEGRWKYIEKEAVLSVPTHMGKNQLYRIDEITDKNDTDISAKAYPIFYDSAKEVFLMDKRPTAKNGQETLDILTEGTKYSGESNISTANTAYFVRRNLLDCILGDKSPSFVRVWGGEVLFDNFKIIVNEHAGGDYGAEVRYGKNMVGVNVSEDMSEVVTRIVPVAYNGRLLTSQMVDSPLINNYAIPYTKEIKFEDVRYFEDIEEGTDTTDLIVCNSQAELDAALIAKCNEQFEAGIDLFKVTIEVDMVALENTEEYKDFKDLVKIGLGDDVSCYHTRLGIETKARAIKIVWDCITNSVKNVILGDYKYDFLKKFNSTMDKVENILREDGSVMAEKVQGILNAMNTQLRYQKNVAQKQDVRAMLFEDLDPNSPTYGAMCYGTQGFQISNKRTADGRDWVWSTAFTAQGGYADVLVAGILADKTGKTFWNLDTGVFQLSPETKITWGQVTGTDDVANKDDIPSDKDTIALIKNNRGTIITKEYIETLKIIAGSVAAEDITGTTISGKTFVSTGQKIFRASDFTEEDLTIVQQIAMKQIDLTDEYLNKYDLNGDGIISGIDYIRIKKLLLGEVDSYTLDTGIEISSGSKDGCLLKTKNVIIRPEGIRSLNVSCDNISIKNFIETYDVKQTLEANAYVSPYTYYGEFEIPSDWIELYGEPICVSAIGVAADPVPATLTKDRRYYRISSNSAKVTARITCLKI